MDPITHGITGALLGKAFFSKRQERVAIFAATLGAIFPDVDISCEVFSRDPLSIVKYHRAITHSFVALPFFGIRGVQGDGATGVHGDGRVASLRP